MGFNENITLSKHTKKNITSRITADKPDRCYAIASDQNMSLFKIVFHDNDCEVFFIHVAKHLGMPFLSAYIKSIGTSYRHGANFAAGSSTVMRQNKTYFDGGTPFTLEIQVEQFNQFKSRTGKFFTQGLKSREEQNNIA